MTDRHAYICDAVRTPIGRYGGLLSTIRADDLAAAPLSALRDRLPNLDWEALDDVILGCANQSGEDNRDVARMALLLAGLPAAVSGVTVNRLCGSGLEAVAQAARAIWAGEGHLFIAGGVESMSRAPFVLPKIEKPFGRDAVLHDTTLGWRFANPRMQAAYGIDPLGVTAENVAEDYGVSRAAQDAMALRSQARAAAAQRSGRFAGEIVPVLAKRGGETIEVSVDEHPRATTAEQLAGLRAAFREGGSVTAGNSSGLNDGSAAMIVASEDAVRRYGLIPRARFVGAATAGVPPRVMGIGPVPATKRLLYRLNLAVEDLDLVELNEAFAAQGVAVLRELDLPEDADFVNPNGGAIALGHPLGMSGARLVLTAVEEMWLTGRRRALCTMCIGVGQGISGILERV